MRDWALLVKRFQRELPLVEGYLAEGRTPKQIAGLIACTIEQAQIRVAAVYLLRRPPPDAAQAASVTPGRGPLPLGPGQALKMPIDGLR